MAPNTDRRSVVSDANTHALGSQVEAAVELARRLSAHRLDDADSLGVNGRGEIEHLEDKNHPTHRPLPKSVIMISVTNGLSKGDILFEVHPPLGFRVRVTFSYWELIVTVKHPVMAGRELDVQETLQNPDEIRVRRSDSAGYLFYKAERATRWVCAVAKHLDRDGFLITAFPTDAIKEGVRVWPT